MARDEDQAEQIVANVIVERFGVLSLDVARFADVTELLVLPVDALVTPEDVDRAMLRGGHEPGPGVVGNADLWPAFQRRNERVLRELLGEPDVAHHSRETRDEPRGLDPPHGVDRAVGLRQGAGAEHCAQKASNEMVGRDRSRGAPPPVSTEEGLEVEELAATADLERHARRAVALEDENSVAKDAMNEVDLGVIQDDDVDRRTHCALHLVLQVDRERQQAARRLARVEQREIVVARCARGVARAASEDPRGGE